MKQNDLSKNVLSIYRFITDDIDLTKTDKHNYDGQWLSYLDKQRAEHDQTYHIHIINLIDLNLIIWQIHPNFNT